MQPLEYWLIAQMTMEVGLIVLVVFFLMRLRSWRRHLAGGQEINPDLAANLQKLAQDLSLLEKKRQAMEEAVEQLNLKVARVQKNLLDSGPQRQKSCLPEAAWESGVSLRAQVEALDRQGLSPEDIAKRLRLNLAEVKVALDLCRVRPS